jgi:serine/threonine protein phosphatase 1
MVPECGHHWEKSGLSNPMPLTYAVGDIHGSLDKLKGLIAACRQHADGREILLVFLGDYIDRGPDSAGVVRFVLTLQSETPGRVIALKGNHEAWALGVADGTMRLGGWLLNGGAATLLSYGVKDAADLPRAHLDWMRSLPLSYDDGRRFFVHAGVNPQKPLDAQDEAELLWIREPFLDDERDYGRLIVHGHTPLDTAGPDLRSNRLNLDTAAVFGGPLTAAVFDDTQTEPLEFLQVE